MTEDVQLTAVVVKRDGKVSTEGLIVPRRTGGLQEAVLTLLHQGGVDCVGLPGEPRQIATLDGNQLKVYVK